MTTHFRTRSQPHAHPLDLYPNLSFPACVHVSNNPFNLSMISESCVRETSTNPNPLIIHA